MKNDSINAFAKRKFGVR